MIIRLIVLFNAFKNHIHEKGVGNLKSSIEEGDYIVLQKEELVETSFVACDAIKYKIKINVIVSYEVIAVDDENISLSQVMHGSVLVSARASDRRPVYITGYAALEKKLLGYK
jgi:hypothetical protein